MWAANWYIGSGSGVQVILPPSGVRLGGATFQVALQPDNRIISLPGAVKVAMPGQVRKASVGSSGVTAKVGTQALKVRICDDGN